MYRKASGTIWMDPSTYHLVQNTYQGVAGNNRFLHTGIPSRSFFQQLPLAHMSSRLICNLEAIKPVLNVATISINPYKWNKCSSEEFSLWFKQREDVIDFDEPTRWRQYNDVTKRWQRGCRVSDWKSMQNYAVKHEEMCVLSKSEMKTSINATSVWSHQQQ